MRNLLRFCKSFVAAFVLISGLAVGATAQEAQDAPPPEFDADALLSQLADPETTNWQQIERRLMLEWSKSGSPAMDLLLMRGTEALESEDWDAALEHLTALTDHAPDFAEGYHARATAYFQTDRYGPALNDLGRALTLNPNHFGALSGLAVILEQLNMGPEALDAWRMLARIHPHRPETKEALERLERQFGGSPL